MTRRMKNTFEGWCFYESAFDPNTGNTVRTYEVPDGRHGHILNNHPRYGADEGCPLPHPWELGISKEERDKRLAAVRAWRDDNPNIRDRWSNLVPGRSRWNRSHAYSPVPELIDVKINEECSFGCPNCYMDSKKGDKGFAPLSMFEVIFDGLDDAPYQIALGGGEPCEHPQLPEILEFIRSKGTVPSYTTAGYKFRPEVIAATNRYCGGVALTYHRHTKLSAFKKTYLKWKKALAPHVQLNIHLIADHGCAQAMTELVASLREEKIPANKISIVLLGYIPIGRGKLDSIMGKKEYNEELPKVLQRLLDQGIRLSFSEPLLPYFLSRPWLEIGQEFMDKQEGIVSCYVDNYGNVNRSSFSEWHPKKSNIYEVRFQDIWDAPTWLSYTPEGQPCSTCKEVSKCAPANNLLMHICEYQHHNVKERATNG